MADWTKHPLLGVPVPSVIARMSAEQLRNVWIERERQIKKLQEDPICTGWVPPVWRLAWCLMGVGWVDPDLAERVRRRLGFETKVWLMQILGGNRGSKTEFAANTVMQQLSRYERQVCWCFQATHTRSVDDQQPIIWRYFPSAWKHEIKSKGEGAYISYSLKRGFTDSKFVLPNISIGSFKNYSMVKEDAIEGGEVDGIWNDELVAQDWVATQKYRVATREGWILNTFTPVQGFSPMVQSLQQGAEVTLYMPAYLLPTDGGPPDIVRALGFSSREEMEWNHKYGRWSIPDSFGDLFGENDDDWNNRPMPNGNMEFVMKDGRRFKATPRVMVSKIKGAAVVFFFSSDNPFGNPKRVAETCVGGAWKQGEVA